MRINHACAPATAPKTWPSSATSLSICCAKSTTNGPSNAAASVPPGTPNICCKYWDRCDVKAAWNFKCYVRPPSDLLLLKEMAAKSIHLKSPVALACQGECGNGSRTFPG